MLATVAGEMAFEGGGGAGPSPPTIEIVVPVHNEVMVTEASIRALRAYLDARFPFEAVVTIADGASTDGTWDVAARVAAQVPGVRAIHVDQRGRGRALRTAWSASEADVVAYMDVDLSTDLDAMLPLVAPLVSGHSDIAIGSRLARGAHVVRGPKREVVSRSYNLLLRATTGKRFTDAQCGFKAARTQVIRQLLPLVEDNDWFFDTELLVLAEHQGLRIHEVPVDWVADPDSSPDILAASLADLKGLWRISRRALAGRSAGPGVSGRNSREEVISRFVTIGGISMVVYLALLLILQPAVGTLGANAIALTLCAVGNAAAHRGLISSLDPTATADPTTEDPFPGPSATAATATTAAGAAIATAAAPATDTPTHSVGGERTTGGPAAAGTGAPVPDTPAPSPGGPASAAPAPAVAEPEPAVAARRLHRWAALRRSEASQAGRAAIIAWAAGLALSTLALLAAAAVAGSIILALVAALAANTVISAGRFVTLRAVMYQNHLALLDRTVPTPAPQPSWAPGRLGAESQPPHTFSQPTEFPTWRS